MSDVLQIISRDLSGIWLRLQVVKREHVERQDFENASKLSTMLSEIDAHTRILDDVAAESEE